MNVVPGVKLKELTAPCDLPFELDEDLRFLCSNNLANAASTLQNQSEVIRTTPIYNQINRNPWFNKGQNTVQFAEEANP